MKKEDAEEFTQSLGQIVAGSWRQIALAKRLGVPAALGMDVGQWVNERLGGYVKLSIAERKEAAKELLAEGESTRNIGSVLGISHVQVQRDLSGTNVPKHTGNSLEIGTNIPPLDAIAGLAAGRLVELRRPTVWRGCCTGCPDGV